MSFNRIKYDNTSFDLQMKRSTDIGDYRLFGSNAENCNQCYSEDGPIGAKSDVSLVKDNMDLSFGKMSDVECALGWRNQKLTKSNKGLDSLDVPVNNKALCDKILVSDDTRFSHPIDNYRGMSLTNYMMVPSLYVNPQCHIQPFNDLTGANSRLKCKDAYVLPKQTYLDNGEALPQAKPEKDDNVVEENKN
jgi:hypothetical protein